MRSKIFLSLAIMVMAGCTESPEMIVLEDSVARMEVTAAYGGRVLSFSLQGRENLLKVGEAVMNVPDPEVSPEANNIPYFGHIVWLGPQNEWWTHQQVNPQRFKAKAGWPPDPYLVFARNKVVERTAEKLVLEGVASPVSGVQLRKTFSLTEKPGMFELFAEAINVSGKELSWDIWFNTRVQPSTSVYVPVTSEQDLRADSGARGTVGPVEYLLSGGLLTLDVERLPTGMTGRRGKLFIQPSAGWMAGFAGEQVFVIEFPLQPKEAIHPAHGQVELYLNYRPESLEDSLIEMEVHAPYRTLKPGEAMRAGERWTVLPYDGPDDKAAHIDFLKKRFMRDS
ncbi:MAG TPA: DUF4380 domain-containing protein [Gammaproteobacteria bacterium]